MRDLVILGGNFPHYHSEHERSECDEPRLSVLNPYQPENEILRLSAGIKPVRISQDDERGRW